MNLTNLLGFQSMQYNGAQTQASSINIFVAQALRVFIEDFYQRIAPAFIVTISCRRSSPMNFFRTIMQLLYESVDDMIIQLVHYNHTMPLRIGGPRTHNLLLVDSLDALLDIELHTYTGQYDSSEYYYIFLQQRDALIPQDMLGVFEYCWRYQLINCNVMTQSGNGEVLMHTYFPYAPTHCGQVVQSVQINKFIGPAWQHRDYFPAKLQDLYQCPLATIVRHMPPYFTAEGDQQFGGLEGQLLLELAKRLNFSIRLVTVTNADADADAVVTEQQMLQLLQQRAAHLAIGYIRKRVRFTEQLTAVFPHYSNMLVSCVALAAYNLTSLQVLRYPFQPLAWLALLASILGMAGLVLLLARTAGGARVGAGGAGPQLLGVYAVLLGLPMTPMPERSALLQLLVLNWLWATLVMRAMYSALIFHLLRQHIHQRLPSTLLEMLRSGYTAVLNSITLQDLRETPSYGQFALASSLVLVLPSELELEVLQTVEQRIRAAAAASFGIMSRDSLLYLVQRSRRPGAYHMLPEHVVEQQLAIYLQKHSHLVQPLDQLVMSIQAVGLMNYWAGQLANERYFHSTFMYAENSLSQHDLWAIYMIGLALYMCALLVFIGELLASRRARRRDKNS